MYKTTQLYKTLHNQRLLHVFYETIKLYGALENSSNVHKTLHNFTKLFKNPRSFTQLWQTNVSKSEALLHNTFTQLYKKNKLCISLHNCANFTQLFCFNNKLYNTVQIVQKTLKTLYTTIHNFTNLYTTLHN